MKFYLDKSFTLILTGLLLQACSLDEETEAFHPTRISCEAMPEASEIIFRQPLPLDNSEMSQSKEQYFLYAASAPVSNDLSFRSFDFGHIPTPVSFTDRNGTCLAAFLVQSLRVLSMKERLDGMVDFLGSFPDNPLLDAYYQTNVVSDGKYEIFRKNAVFVDIYSFSDPERGFDFFLFEDSLAAISIQ